MDLALGMDNMNKDLENGGMEDRVVEVEYEDINRDLGNSETEDEVVEVEGEDQDLLGNIQGERDGESGVKLKTIKRWNWKGLSACACLCFVYFTSSSAFSFIGLFFPEEVEDKKGFSPVVAGFIIGCSALCMVIFSPVFGYFLPRLGTRFMISLGLLLIGGSFILLGFVDKLPSNWIFVVGCVLLRATEGVGSAMFNTATFAVVPVIFPNHVATVVGMFKVASGIGYAAGAPLGGLLYQSGGFKLPFLCGGVLLLLSILPCVWLVKGNITASPSKTRISILIALKSFTDLPFVLLVLISIWSIACLTSVSTTVQPFLSDQFGLNPLEIGLVFGGCGPLTYMFVTFAVGPLSDRLGHRWFIVTGMILFALGLFFIGPAEFIGTPRLWVTCVALIVVGIAAAFAIIPPFADMLKIAKRYLKGSDEKDVAALNAIVSGVVSSSVSLGEFFGPLIGGALTNVYSFASSAVLFAEVAFAMAVLLLGVTLIERHTHVHKELAIPDEDQLPTVSPSAHVQSKR